MKNPKAYKQPFGVWEVTTQGDCEGRSVRNLGIHAGYLDDIAFALADKQFRNLCFKAVQLKTLDMLPKRKEVNVSLDIDSGTWDMTNSELRWFWQEMMKDRDVQIKPGNGFCEVTLVSTKRTLEDVRQEALAKLSKEERVALGLEI